ncbi:MAG: hypothetical protein QME96_15900, partial [Myxococcota bacterium]|nr:hypothetical protein [Myxococcota bacterium]
SASQPPPAPDERLVARARCEAAEARLALHGESGQLAIDGVRNRLNVRLRVPLASLRLRAEAFAALANEYECAEATLRDAATPAFNPAARARRYAELDALDYDALDAAHRKATGLAIMDGDDGAPMFEVAIEAILDAEFGATPSQSASTAPTAAMP